MTDLDDTTPRLRPRDRAVLIVVGVCGALLAVILVIALASII